MELEIKTCEPHSIDIYIAGDFNDAKRICKDFCNKIGQCVTVEKIEFIYTGGQEEGVKVSFKNYPRFPKSYEDLLKDADKLCLQLIDGLYQRTALLQTDTNVYWYNGKYKESKF